MVDKPYTEMTWDALIKKNEQAKQANIEAEAVLPENFTIKLNAGHLKIFVSIIATVLTLLVIASWTAFLHMDGKIERNILHIDQKIEHNMDYLNTRIDSTFYSKPNITKLKKEK